MRSGPERKATRLPGFDYGTPGIYFVTICLHDMTQLRFGDVRDDTLLLNDAGSMVSDEWAANIERYPGSAIDAFVVMPNHLHGIVMTGTDPDLKPANLIDIIATFKSITTAAYGRGVRAGHFAPFETALWQRSFYDRIIRDETSLERARAYIEGNPSRWIEKHTNPRAIPKGRVLCPPGRPQATIVFQTHARSPTGDNRATNDGRPDGRGRAQDPPLHDSAQSKPVEFDGF